VTIHLGRRDFIAGLGGVAIGGAAAWIYATRAHDRARALLSRLLRMQAENIADRISEFIDNIESQVGWTLQLPLTEATLDQNRFDDMRLLRQSAAIVEVIRIDSTGRERLRLSRVQVSPIPKNDQDYSQDPKFTQAMINKRYFGPVYFYRESQPHMTLSLAGPRGEVGVSLVEVNLNLIWDLINNTKVGSAGKAYLVDRNGRLIAHPDISLVLRNTDMTQLAQVRTAVTADGGGAAAQEGKDLSGRNVLTVYAPVARLGWLAFVEVPVKEADALTK
jgi:two-component system, NtrC family, sensor kinase